MPLTTRLWVPAPAELLARVLGLVDAGDHDLRAAVGALATLPGLPVLPLDSLEEPAAGASSAGRGRIGVRFPLSSHRVVTELALRWLLDRCAGADPPVVLLPAVPDGQRGIVEVPALPLACLPAATGVELATVNHRPGRCSAYVTDEALVVVPGDLHRPEVVAALIANHRRFEPDHCVGDRVLAGVAEWGTVPGEVVDAALIAHELIVTAEALRQPAAVGGAG